MKVFMIGGTGLLGCEAARILIEKGHEVKSVALPPLPEGAPIPKEMELIFKNINDMTDEEILGMLDGCDCFVFAAVVLGSYFSWLAKERPDMPICEKNPYIKSRIDQEKVCEKYADDSFDVSVLELPYIFGTQPGRRPVWVILIEQIAFMDKWPFTMYPKGGTTMLTVRQVGQAIAGAVEKEVGGFRAFKIGMYNLTWNEFLAIVYEARGMKGRKVLGVAPWMMKMGMGKVVKDYAARGIDSGMDPMYLPYIMDVNIFTEQKDCLELGVTEDDIKAAIFDSIKVSEDAYNGKVKLLEMKGE